jgi:FKBP-type peptidyl-prolyl cis-trans isomerase FklB
MFTVFRTYLIIGTVAFTLSLNAQLDTMSYSVGMSVGAKLLSDGASQLNYDSFLEGLRDKLEKKETIISKDRSDQLNYQYFQSQRELMFTKVKEEGQEFLTKNGQRPEVTTTESGLQYEVLVAAEGEMPIASSTVTVHYVGTLLSGEKFDSSVDRGEPISFPLNRVIAGWTEGLQLMPVGSKYRFFIPQDLAYGSRGAGAAIPPYSALIFDVELLSFK